MAFEFEEKSWKEFDLTPIRTSQTNGLGAAGVAVSAGTAAMAATGLIATNMATAAAATAATASAASITVGATAAGATLAGGATVAGAGAGAFTTAAASSAIPVAGWIVAAAAVIVGVTQVVVSSKERKEGEQKAIMLKEINDIIARNLELAAIVANTRIRENNKRIALMEKRFIHEKRIEMITATMLGVVGLAIAYRIHTI